MIIVIMIIILFIRIMIVTLLIILSPVDLGVPPLEIRNPTEPKP